MTRTWIDRPEDPRIADYGDMRASARLRERGLFVAESRQVVRGLLADGRFPVKSLLLNEAAERGLEAELATLAPDVQVFVTSSEHLSGLAGFPVHQGCLALASRPDPISCADLIDAATKGRGLLVLLEAVGDPDNVGAVFRNAEGFGADGILMAGGGDPLYRKAIRVSMGASLRVPFGQAQSWPAELQQLRDAGFVTFAAVADDSAEDVKQLQATKAPPRRALLLGAEGEGISEVAQQASDRRLTIRTVPRFDSLNVATASGILLHHLSALA